MQRFGTVIWERVSRLQPMRIQLLGATLPLVPMAR